MSESLVKRAAEHLAAADYIVAQRLYQQAGERYGYELFRANIKLCRKRIDEDFDAVKVEQAGPDEKHQPTASTALDEQLRRTQEMLEYYYIRCQELEAQLIDGRPGS